MVPELASYIWVVMEMKVSEMCRIGLETVE